MGTGFGRISSSNRSASPARELRERERRILMAWASKVSVKSWDRQRLTGIPSLSGPGGGWSGARSRRNLMLHLALSLLSSHQARARDENLPC
jgi:hypothetical protein